MRNTKTSRLRPYLVTYAVQRSETYRVIAKSRRDAEARAYEEGERAHEGDTTDCAVLDCSPDTEQREDQ
jgi:hypothetical protein